MYKCKIKAWDIDKNNKKHEVETILHLKAARDAAGKTSVFFCRGRPVDWTDIQRYAKRNKIDPAGFKVLTKSRQDALERIVCRSPSPSPSLTLASSAASMKLFRSIAIMASDALRRGRYTHESIWRAPNHCESEILMFFKEAIQAALRNESKGEIQSAFFEWGQTFRYLRRILISWNRDSIIYILMAFQFFEAPHHPVAHMLQCHTRDWACKLFPLSDPRREALLAIAEVEAAHIFEVSMRASRCLLDHLNHPGHMTSEWILPLKVVISHSLHQLDPSFSIGVYIPTVAQADQLFGPCHGYTLSVMQLHVFILFKQKLFLDAEVLAQQMIERTTTMEDRINHLGWETTALYNLTMACWGLEKGEAAQQYAKKTLRRDNDYLRERGYRLLGKSQITYLYNTLALIASIQGGQDEVAFWQAKMNEMDSDLLAEDDAEDEADRLEIAAMPQEG